MERSASSINFSECKEDLIENIETILNEESAPSRPSVQPFLDRTTGGERAVPPGCTTFPGRGVLGEECTVVTVCTTFSGPGYWDRVHRADYLYNPERSKDL
jgi:hypothetical protein